MRKNILHGLFSACLTSAQLLCASENKMKEHGVGFSLSLDYGVASVYFSNGSAADIAKVEGGPSYKQMMRVTEIQAAAGQTFLNEALRSSTGAAQASMFQQSSPDHLPLWLGKNNPRTDSMTRMITALKTATESYLETSLSFAEVVFPFPISNTFLDNLRSACSALSVHLPKSAQDPAGVLTARFRGIGGQCSYLINNTDLEQTEADDPAQLILTVDYSRAALIALLVTEECGVFEVRRTLYRIDLGSDALSRSDSAHVELARALYNITLLPLEDGNGAEVKQISEMILLGESAGDLRLHDVLKEVLGGNLINALTAVKARQEKIIDPVFAASMAVAWDCWDRLASSG